MPCLDYIGADSPPSLVAFRLPRDADDGSHQDTKCCVPSDFLTAVRQSILGPPSLR